jgi:hypothetical protein
LLLEIFALTPHRLAFVCHHNSLLIYGSLKTPTIDNFSRVTHYSTGISMLACLAMALAGFLTFGDRTLGNVLNNFPSDNIMVNVARLCFGLNMLTTLPLEAFVCREVMLTYFFPDEPFNMNRHLLFSTSLVAAAMVLSLVTCDLGAVFELVGATSAVVMAYVLPPLCYIKLTTRSWRTYLAYAVAAFGMAVMVISVVQAVGKMMNRELHPFPQERCLQTHFLHKRYDENKKLTHLHNSIRRASRVCIKLQQRSPYLSVFRRSEPSCMNSRHMSSIHKKALEPRA